MPSLKVFALFFALGVAAAFGVTKPVRLGRLSTALDASILETAAAAGNFKTLLAAVEAAGLTSALSGPGPLTLFAPSDAAFEKLPAGTVDALLKDLPTLTNILKFHVHPGKMSPTRNGKTYNTLMDGADKYPKQLTIKVTGWTIEKFIITGQPNIAEIVADDIKCDNGLIHVINEVLMPYEGNHPPKVTFLGARDLDGTKTLQQGYYGGEAGTGRHGERYDGPDVPFNAEEFPIGDAWQVGGNWRGGLEGDVKYKEYDVKK